MQATVSSKGQVTIPKEIRQSLHLGKGAKLDFRLDDNGELRVTPVNGSVRDLKGMLPKPDKVASLSDMDEAIANGADDR